MGRVRRPRNSVFRNLLELQYDESIKYKLYRSVKGSQDWVQRLGLLKILPVHSGCVNCICWNERGDSLLSGSDDQHLVISHAYNYKVLYNYKTSHKANIFSAKFLPCTNDKGIVSCSGDGMILYSDLLRIDETLNNVFNCHVGTTYEVATIPNDPHTFLSCGEDYTVRSFDLRTKEKCIKQRCVDICNEDVIISCQRAVTALTVNAVSPFQLAIGCSDSTVRLYDRRMLTPGAGDMAKPLMTYIAPGMEGRSYRITSLSFSPHGEDILVSYSSEQLYLFGLKSGETTTLTTTEQVVEEPSSFDSPVTPVRRLRLRGDWSDTGPDARPQNYPPPGGAGQARPTLHGTLMQRMTDVLSRMLNDPATRAALSHGGEGAITESDQSSHSDPTAHGGSEGEETEDGGGNLNVNNDSASRLRLSIIYGGSEGEEGEEDGGSLIENNDSASRLRTSPVPNPIDLPLPSFSSSFTQPPQNEDLPENMDLDAQNTSCETEASEEVEPKGDAAPSTSTASSTQPSASTSTPQSTPQKSNISHFNELSTVFHGFVEKTGVEPMVNLTYSDVGSTASCISVFVREEGARDSFPDGGAPDSENSSPGDWPGSQPSHQPSPGCKHRGQSEGDVEPSSDHDSHMADEDSCDSDNDNDVNPVIGVNCRLIHPIEKHMDEAIKNVRSECSLEDIEESSFTRKSYFKQKYVGHRNARTMIKEATFWGDDYVISGSDCGHVFMWEKECGRLRMLLEADQHVVNCVQPHPYLPILATSGIDYDVKLWAPVHCEPAFEQEMADELMKRNAVMLEETKDTITVPASFMIRMLACLNQIRRGGGRSSRQQRRDSNPNSD